MDEKYNCNHNNYMKTPEIVKRFLEDYKILCEKYNLALGHEDAYGAFILYNYDESLVNWVLDCILAIEEE